MREQIYTKYSLEFAEKYQAVVGIYTYDEEQIKLYVSPKFDYLNIYNISTVLGFIPEIVTISVEEFKEQMNNLALQKSKYDSIARYEEANSEQPLIQETTEEFYDLEIKNAPIVKMIDTILEEAINYNSSDIHFEPAKDGLIVRFRIDGVLKQHEILPITSLQELVTRIKVLSSLDITKRFIPQDGKFKFKSTKKEYDIRVSILPTIYGEMITLRILELNHNVISLKDLELDDNDRDKLQRLASLNSGLVLMCGPTGSGKSTSLQAMIKENLKKNVNIITVEDPVEFTIPGVNQVQVNKEMGLDFPVILRNILRQDPNIIMIGEIRDVETAKTCCRASITGHLVFSTLHTQTSIGVINRLVDMDVEPYILVDALKGIVAQRLVRKLCPYCKKELVLTNNDLGFTTIPQNVKIYKPCGCKRCYNTGYKGRIGVFEIIEFDEDFRDLLISDAPKTKYEKLIKKKKIPTLQDSAIKLLLDGLTSIEEVKKIIN